MQSMNSQKMSDNRKTLEDKKKGNNAMQLQR